MDAIPGFKIDVFYRGNQADVALFNIKYDGVWYLVNFLYPFPRYYPDDYPPELLEVVNSLNECFHFSEADKKQHPNTLEFNKENVLTVLKKSFDDAEVDMFYLRKDFIQ